MRFSLPATTLALTITSPVCSFVMMSSPSVTYLFTKHALSNQHSTLGYNLPLMSVTCSHACMNAWAVSPLVPHQCSYAGMQSLQVA